MGQVGQMLNQNDFLGGLGNLEGSFLIGIVSIVYSLAIAVIPFIAKRIVSGDVGSTAAAMVGTAVTALTAGAPALKERPQAWRACEQVQPAEVGRGFRRLPQLQDQHERSRPSAERQPARSAATAPDRCLIRKQRLLHSGDGSPTLEGHADQIRSSISDAMGTDEASDESSGAITVPAEGAGVSQSQPSGATRRPTRGCQIVGLGEERAERTSLQPRDMDRLSCRPDCGRQHRRSNPTRGRSGLGGHHE